MLVHDRSSARSGFLAGLGSRLQGADQDGFGQLFGPCFVPPRRGLPPGPEWLTLFAFVAAGADADEVRSDVPATPAFRHNMIQGEDTCFDAAVGAGATEAGFDFGADMVFARSVVEIHGRSVLEVGQFEDEADVDVGCVVPQGNASLFHVGGDAFLRSKTHPTP
jgi:hypothetical protein